MNEEKYIELFSNLKYLIENQLTYLEDEDINIHEVANILPAIISLINTIGYLRGQNGMFLNIRPATGKQEYFYQTEKELENRLQKLIDKVSSSTEETFYKNRLHEYFCKARSIHTIV